MKVSDYIVEYLIENGVRDVFGYPGGMVTHFMDSIERRHDIIKQHLAYNEQGAAMAACGYAQASNHIGIAYATSGPGATNLITGICNAFYDSVPVVFITGQVNTTESKSEYNVRQRGFQETDIVEVVRSITKYAEYVSSPNRIKYCLDKAFCIASSGRKGPTLLDIPMDVLRAEIDLKEVEGFSFQDVEKKISDSKKKLIRDLIKDSSQPVIIVGNGIKNGDCVSTFRQMMKTISIPVVTSMLAVDVPEQSFGFIGAYGHRAANFIVAKSDLIISIGARLDIRQVGAVRERFASSAKIIRFDIDSGELEYHVHDDEIDVNVGAETAIEFLTDILLHNDADYSNWMTICDYIKKKLYNIDKSYATELVANISSFFSDDSIVTSDVGQNQVWVSQAVNFSKKKLITSGGLGAMGYSLPAAIGASIASRQTVYCFVGDGGIQMNIQELQFISREKLPVKIILLNNSSLGLIRQFQEKYFNSYFSMTTRESGFSNPNFQLVAEAYGIRYQCVEYNQKSTMKEILEDDKACLIEIVLPDCTFVAPKLEFGKPNQDQEPLLDRTLYEEIMQLGI